MHQIVQSCILLADTNDIKCQVLYRPYNTPKVENISNNFCSHYVVETVTQICLYLPGCYLISFFLLLMRTWIYGCLRSFSFPHKHSEVQIMYTCHRHRHRHVEKMSQIFIQLHAWLALDTIIVHIHISLHLYLESSLCISLAFPCVDRQDIESL